MQTHNRVLVPEDRPRKPGRDLMRAAYAHAKSAAAASTIAPETIAQSLWRDEVVNVLTRGASSPATTTDPLWASALARQEIGSYLTSLEPLSAGARLLNLAPRASLDGIASISFPRKAGPTAAQASWVGEFEPIPVPSFSPPPWDRHGNFVRWRSQHGNASRVAPVRRWFRPCCAKPPRWRSTRNCLALTRRHPKRRRVYPMV
jgi:hypothetical protein